MTDFALRDRAQNNQLTLDDLYAAMTTKLGYQTMRKVLWQHAGAQSHPRHVADLIDQAMPDQAKAVQEREAAETREAERRRREAVKADKAKAAERAEQEKLRRAVEQARARRENALEAELLDEAKAELAGKG